MTHGICPAPDISSLASDYLTFVAILAGFGFTGLVVYLQRESDEGVKGSRIVSSDVAASLLYSTASLAICAFLYVSIAGHPYGCKMRTLIFLICNGALGLSVLLMLYSASLAICEVRYTRSAACFSYLLTVIVGPAVIFRFLIDSGSSAWLSSQGKGPTESSQVYGLGDVGIILLAFLAWMFTRWAIKVRRGKWAPALPVFLAISVVAILSIATSGPSSLSIIFHHFSLPDLSGSFSAFTAAALIIEWIALLTFSVQCGLVIHPLLKPDKAPALDPEKLSLLAHHAGIVRGEILLHASRRQALTLGQNHVTDLLNIAAKLKKDLHSQIPKNSNIRNNYERLQKNSDILREWIETETSPANSALSALRDALSDPGYSLSKIRVLHEMAIEIVDDLGEIRSFLEESFWNRLEETAKK